MKTSLSFLLLFSWLYTALPATAKATPVVITDVPTTHSLVCMVMGSLGDPVLLLERGASPHDYSMRPSDASALSKADVVFWTSSQLTPWLHRSLSAAAPDLVSLELLQTKDTYRLPLRQTADFSAHAHEHDQDSSKNASRNESHETDPHSWDPHAWLNPVNAQYWLRVIADTLSELDPAQATTYQANAQRGIEKLQSLDRRLSDTLQELKGKTYLVFHDSYQYFEEHFGLPATATISLGDGTLPGIRQVNALRKVLKEHPGACTFSEPQFSERLIGTITRGLDAQRGELDPLGARLEPGPELYEQVMDNLALSLHDCLAN